VNWAKEFVELDKAVHYRDSFHCGEAELDRFIREFAVKHMKANISKTMILPASKPLLNSKYQICAFYTVAPSSIHRENLPDSYKKELPYYPIPVFLIAQMAVHSDCQGQGLGKITLIRALEYLWKINHHMRAYAVIVNCLNSEIEKFYSKYQFEILIPNEGRTRMFLPMDTVGMLFQQKY